MTPETTAAPGVPEVPLFGRVPKAAVLERFNRLMADEVCRCNDCVAAGVQGPPVLRPAGVDVVNGRHVVMGLWLHGERLREMELQKLRFALACEAAVARIKQQRVS